ncbi:hypothetical protein Syun_012421 [Stephania yunnanensis]|uniref:Uncharacterized protein n=1 Tax=Stephania yunnanensis TaxID=152371 RepID=A0AAP0PJG5_9MAGN
MRDAMEPSLKALASENIREHSDVDVKVAATSCVSEITRITAPDAPLEEEQMRDLAKELLDTFTARQMGKPENVIALNEGEDELNIDVNSDKLEMPQIESKEDQPLVLVQPPTLPCIFSTPYKGVEVREHLQIFYTADTFVLDDPDTIDSFVLEVLDELLNLKEGVHASLPNYVDAPFVVDISKGEGIM